MKVEIIPSNWLIKEGHRLDCQPFTSGGIAARMAVEKLSCKKDLLKEVTLDGLNGIYHVGQEKIRWVESKEYGIPFLRSSDILRANLDNLTWISKEQVSKNPLFLFPEGATLITRSGTIGRTVYARKEMSEMAASQDVLKVVADPNKILSGYLYAYISSSYGMPQVISGTFGSVIVHIEAENIADLPVPRLGEDVERKVHELIQSASKKRTAATLKQKHAVEVFYGVFKLERIIETRKPENFYIFTTSSSNLYRLDGFHYSPNSLYAATELSKSSKITKQIGEVAKVFTPNIFKRIYVDEPSYGYPYFSGSELFQIYPENRGYLSKKAPNIIDYVVKKNWLLIQDAGQVGGLIGRIVRVSPNANNSAVSNHLMRIVPKSSEDAGYLFAVLSSPHGYRSIVRHAFGSSIPQLDPSHIQNIFIPWAEDKQRQKIADIVLEAWDLFDQADVEEKSAIAIVNEIISEGGV